MRFPKPIRESPAAVAARREARAASLRLLSGKPVEEPVKPGELPERVRCCEKARRVNCYCGGARQCEVHGGPVCFGSYSHD